MNNSFNAADPKSNIRCLLAKNQYDCINLSLIMQIKQMDKGA
jgi:hypothetical protein